MEGIQLLAVEGDQINRMEFFDEADIDAAIASFDELNPPRPRLRNAASRVAERIWTYFAARDWDVAGETLTDDTLVDDRRRVVNAGIRRGRDAALAEISDTRRSRG